MAALDGMACKVVLIAGGDGKGQDFCATEICPGARVGPGGWCLSAEMPTGLLQPWREGVPVRRAADMEQAVTRGFAEARSGRDAAKASPGCAAL